MSTVPLFGRLGNEQILENRSEIESFCMNCEKNGVTSLLMINIPHFQNVVVSSFTCEHCYHKNTELFPISDIKDYGVRHTLCVNSTKEEKQKDLCRHVVKSNYATAIIPELDFEIPPESQKGTISTVEGVIQRAIEGLRHVIIENASNPELVVKISDVVNRLGQLIDEDGDTFTFILDDPSGNSHLESPLAPERDPHCTIEKYIRTIEQDEALNIQSKSHDATAGVKGLDAEDSAEVDFTSEIMSFQSPCPSCGVTCETNMKPVKIPHFRQVIIMASLCESCGFRSDEVKSGTGVEPKGVRFTLTVKTTEDLNRNILKSETSTLRIPILDIELHEGTLGGKFTTIEGIILDISRQLGESNPFAIGDSSDQETRAKFEAIVGNLKDLLQLRKEFEIIIEDAAGNSFVQSINPEGDDERLFVEHFERSFDQNEALGLNDLQVENYQVDDS